MNWRDDRLLLIFKGAACTFACWLVIRLTGEWFATLMLVVSYLVLFAEDSRLRKLLEHNGSDPRRRRARE